MRKQRDHFSRSRRTLHIELTAITSHVRNNNARTPPREQRVLAEPASQVGVQGLLT